MQSLFSILVRVLILTSALPTLAAAAAPYPLERAAIERAFALPSRERIDASLASAAFDIPLWIERDAREFKTRRGRAAVAAYFSCSLSQLLKLPEVIKNKKLESIWAKLALSEEERRRLLELPIQFAIRDVEESEGYQLVYLQLYPELTGDDADARATVVLSSGSQGRRVVDAYMDGVSLQRVLAATLGGFRGQDEALIGKLIEKELVTSAQIEDFGRVSPTL